ncbi:bifunctional UDP-sugar hydrolase/5'-nucleotidase [Nocardioides sp. STR2]|uniref:Bifunctional UDP-sugar hydrolase/5'-nucleotidase n=1 Tax=Nocardioides pini TaxID=2975053 RepID=A0ABT4CBE3_9ACTN|nr:bifunctional UDP-sugar hydrolase/5'-nucleotidase [Nocardioides pini]MCY4726293.1 bifunctional UDP-sugar hydrolase/5'-nucleotidase [Nocardioides pini]
MTGLLAAPLAVVTTAVPAQAAPVDIQILATNDFHGRLLPNTSNGAQEAGAAQFAGAVKQLESDYPNSTVFTAAGDLIGASTFESFIQRDKPTLDALNIAGLDVSAAGNHEFDAGYDDLVNRVMKSYDATTNPEGGAKWQYIAANVKEAGDHSAYALPDVTPNTPDPSDVSDGGTWMTTMNGVNVGFVGAVTEDLPALVSPSGIADIYVDDIVDTVNQGAADLKADGADIVVMLIHEGASSENIAALSDGSAFAQIVAGVDPTVSAIISGHTHLAYNHADPNADTAGRPVVSAGQYGTNLNKLVFTVDPDTDSVALKSKDIVRANTVSITAPAATAARDAAAAVVQDAVTKADVLGARELGQVAMPFNRAKLSNGNENRGGESTLGNLVAEVQRWATGPESSGTAQIAFMNPGGLRTDMLGNNAAGYPAVLTYKQAAVVQPFANTLVTMDMTGAQIKTLLEQQWQRDGSGNVPSRPFLRLGTSEGFEFTYDATRAEGSRITGMWLNGTAIAPATVYSVTANSFLASGGDNFRAFNLATNKRDSGRVDLQAMVDYMAAKTPVEGDTTQHAVGLSFPPEAPSVYHPGEHVRFSVSSWAFTGAGDPQDKTVTVEVDGTDIGSLPVDNTLGTAVFDDYGKITGDVEIPVGTPPGAHVITLVGDTTGTSLEVPVQTDRAPIKSDATVTALATPSTVKAPTGTSVLDVTVATPGHKATGLVAALLGGEVIGGAELVDGKAALKIGPFATAGEKLIEVKYYGDQATKAASGQVSVTVEPAPVVEKATPTLTATVTPSTVQVKKDGATVSLTVTKPSGTATGAVIALVGGKVVGAGELAGGKADIALQPFEEAGAAAVTLKYFGDETTKAAEATVTVEVTKASPRAAVRAPKRVERGERAVFRLTLKSADNTPSGKVTVKVAGKKVTKKLKAGKATFRIKMTKLGKNKVVISYSGDDTTAATKKVVRVRVTR